MIPSIEITETGINAPPTAEVIASLWEMFKSAFGSDLNTSMNTPQGQLVTSLAAIITDERNQWIGLMNQVDPRYSSGIWQDAIGYIYFMTRKQATHSTIKLTLTGLTGVTVKASSVFLSEDGNQWLTAKDAMIESVGTIVVDAICATEGPVDAAARTITIIGKS